MASNFLTYQGKGGRDGVWMGNYGVMMAFAASVFTKAQEGTARLGVKEGVKPEVRCHNLSSCNVATASTTTIYRGRMVLESIKSLLRYPRSSMHYLAGVNGFLEYAYKEKSEDTEIHCPYVNCVLTKLLSKNDVYDHLVCNGMLQSYEEWDFHGDSSEGNISNQQPHP
uniref:Transposase-associated domain-containing protein n=1 Tax=Oryza brachyantha TaxID=4533 RepID=J3MJZ6_ORYBR